MELSGWHHTPATLPPKKDPPQYPLDKEQNPSLAEIKPWLSSLQPVFLQTELPWLITKGPMLYKSFFTAAI